MSVSKLIHRETCLNKEVINFITHLETLRANAWTNDGMEVFGMGAVGLLEHIDIGLDDALLCAFPSGMDSRNDLAFIVPKEDRNAVGSAYTDAYVRDVGGEGIHTIERKCLLQRILVQKGFVDDDSACLMRLMERHEETGNGNGNTAISCGGEGGDM